MIANYWKYIFFEVCLLDVLCWLKNIYYILYVILLNNEYKVFYWWLFYSFKE